MSKKLLPCRLDAGEDGKAESVSMVLSERVGRVALEGVDFFMLELEPEPKPGVIEPMSCPKDC